VNEVLKTVTLVGTLVFLPVAAIYHWVLDTGAGDRHDLIIGVDGERVHDVNDLENALGKVKEDDIVYLNVLRAGKQLLVPVSLAGVGSK
jgi:S1-C subfamily serine protease